MSAATRLTLVGLFLGSCALSSAGADAPPAATDPKAALDPKATAVAFVKATLAGDAKTADGLYEGWQDFGPAIKIIAEGNAASDRLRDALGKRFKDQVDLSDFDRPARSRILEFIDRGQVVTAGDDARIKLPQVEDEVLLRRFAGRWKVTRIPQFVDVVTTSFLRAATGFLNDMAAAVERGDYPSVDEFRAAMKKKFEETDWYPGLRPKPEPVPAGAELPAEPKPAAKPDPQLAQEIKKAATDYFEAIGAGDAKAAESMMLDDTKERDAVRAFARACASWNKLAAAAAERFGDAASPMKEVGPHSAFVTEVALSTVSVEGDTATLKVDEKQLHPLRMKNVDGRWKVESAWQTAGDGDDAGKGQDELMKVVRFADEAAAELKAGKYHSPAELRKALHAKLEAAEAAEAAGKPNPK